ncbi:MAG: translation initiation factor IF-2 [Myxococcota bacterium]
MIDRDKLLERVPSNRLGGGKPNSAPSNAPQGGNPRSYGQVTELKVVNDPFGRGREMVAVGKDKKGKKVVRGGRPAPAKRGRADMRERHMHPSRLKRKKAAKRVGAHSETTQPKASKRIIKMKETITIAELGHQLGIKAIEIVRYLMNMGTMVTINASIDFETAQVIAAEHEYTVESIAFAEGAILDEPTEENNEGNLTPRPPVVTVMGHVDHGKTSLLDAIRKAKVASGEAGGITQHIGAYSVEVKGKGSVTFIDTPGHAAFTEMRARGAQVTDIVVLVVAADDGVMPQTEEAIRHAQAAGVPIIVAVNKMDRPDANADKVTQELTQFSLVPEAWGGETLFVQTSAIKKQGIDELLDAILLQAEVLDLKANRELNATGIVVEAKLDKGRGPVATILIQHGILNRGDHIVIGEHVGRVRAMTDHTGKQVKAASPSDAVEIIGLEGVPNAGDRVHRVSTSEQAREVANHRIEQKKAQEQAANNKMSLDDLMKRMSGEEAVELTVVLKADVQGSIEAVRTALLKLSTEEVRVNVIYAGVGAITESDIMLASASNALIFGFNVRPDGNARNIAQREGVEIRVYNVIYELIDEVRKAMEGLLTPESQERVLGRAEVREVFKISKVGTIAGCRLIEGKGLRSARVRVLRDSAQVYDGRVSSLKRFKDDAREVESGQECGIGVEGFNDIKQNDMIEFYEIEEIARTLDSPPPPKKQPRSTSMEAHP